jgi:hypothetical protein
VSLLFTLDVPGVGGERVGIFIRKSKREEVTERERKRERKRE